MTKRSRRSSSRPSRSPSRRAQPAKLRQTPWWKRPIPIIAAVGTVAGTVTAVVALIHPLLPQHSDHNVAHINSVEALSKIPLSEFMQRSAVIKLQSADQPQGHRPRLAAVVVARSSPSATPNDTTAPSSTAPPPTQSPTTPSSTQPPPTTPSSTAVTPTSSVSVTTPTGTTSPACLASQSAVAPAVGSPSPSCTASPSGTASSSPSGSPSGTGSATGGIELLFPPGMSAHAAVAYANQVAALAEKMDPGIYIPKCRPGNLCPVYDLGPDCRNSAFLIKNRSNCVASKAAQLTETRLLGGTGNPSSGGPGNPSSAGPGNPSSGTSTKRQPLGELISVNLELAGLKGQQVFLSWSIFPKNGSNHLSKNWLGEFIAYRLVATTNDDTGTLQLWIPLPKQLGPYFVRLNLMTAEDVNLASMDSNPFD